MPTLYFASACLSIKREGREIWRLIKEKIRLLDTCWRIYYNGRAMIFG